MRVFAATCWLVAAACSGSGALEGGAAGSAVSMNPRGSAGGFSAALAADLKTAGVGSAEPSAPAPPAAPAAPGPAAGSAAAAPAPAAGSAAAAPAPATGSAAAADVGPTAVTAGRHAVPVSPELAAIKLELELAWDRDFEEPGTFSFVLHPPKGDPRVFWFQYGYDEPGAPTDHAAYIKFLADHHLLNVTLERQRGAAWYLEGTDSDGTPAFRYIITYGGKRLTCHGSLYKDPASNPLGDLRDKIVIAAKKICESASL